jgi:hypothetical protein
MSVTVPIEFLVWVNEAYWYLLRFTPLAIMVLSVEQELSTRTLNKIMR